MYRMKNLVIRKAASDELSSIQAVARDVIRACYTAFLGADRVAEFIDSGQSDQEFVAHEDHLFVALEEDRPFGFSICFDDVVHLLMIRSDAQGRGYGSHLLGWCEKTIGERGFRTGRLETFAGNAQAMRFYQRNGWFAVSRDAGEEGALARIRFEKQLS